MHSQKQIAHLIKQGTFKRAYRRNSTKSSLNPAIAFLLNYIAELDDNDRILDPCCGTATILIERQLLKEAICVGVDIDPQVLELAKENIQEANIQIELKHGDIKDKKFPDNYFTKIISNLPYGIHSGSREKNIELYKFLADNSVKWLKKDGKAIFLTNAKSLLKNTFSHNPSWNLIEEIPLSLGQMNLSIFIFKKI